MKSVQWETKFDTVLQMADQLMRDGNEKLDLSDKAVWGLASMVGYEIETRLDIAHAFDGDDFNGLEARTLHEWIERGLTLEDDFPDWSGPQLMAAYACYLVADAEQWLDDLPAPGARHSNAFHGYERHDVIEHCASNIIEAMESCHYGRLLIGKTIVPDEEWLAEYARKVTSEKARQSSIGKWQSKFEDGWKAHCARVMESGHKIERLNDLQQIDGYDPGVMNIKPATLRKWAREAGVTFKSGRPKES